MCSLWHVCTGAVPNVFIASAAALTEQRCPLPFAAEAGRSAVACVAACPSCDEVVGKCHDMPAYPGRVASFGPHCRRWYKHCWARYSVAQEAGAKSVGQGL